MKGDGDAVFSGGNGRDLHQLREQYNGAKKSVGAKNSSPKEFAQEDIVSDQWLADSMRFDQCGSETEHWANG